MDFLPGALPFDLADSRAVDPDLAAEIVWFDWLITNIDRTPRNPNLLTWHGEIWLIDHGAAFFRQHGAVPLSETSATADPDAGPSTFCFRQPARSIVGGRPADRSGQEAVPAAVAAVPSEWLGSGGGSRREQFRAVSSSAAERRTADGQTTSPQAIRNDLENPKREPFPTPC